ncbi:GNAT family N-acetyltransferase [Chachezhania antarctica]|uniref:GNAT family N-acetyltransferase n=1 Tax=Chachezhania antarctica TaxID=2340860 RepID=UPI000EB0FFC8|nr:GNAT family N-acetyltransferase [Chachezhania antarctica]|tara:strand:- start:4292 stop:5146 length:855 start_codon:yes stop_codon:yes gene_type:complete
MTDYIIRPLNPGETDIAVSWAAQEGWNPGASDAVAFRSVDPHGFWGGFLDGEMVGSISVVNYDEDFAFLGFYIVRPGYRGMGLGLQLWETASRHAGQRVIGLDGVVDQQANYRKSGYVLAYRNIRQGGPAGPALRALGQAPEATAPLAEVTPALDAYDRELFPAPRPAFLEAWITSPGHAARVKLADGVIRGYAVLRPCVSGYKIGPLFADDADVARDLLRDLLAGVEPEAEIFLDTPEPNAAAVDLAGTLGLVPVFETARMYRGAAPDLPVDRIFGVCTFELG